MLDVKGLVTNVLFSAIFMGFGTGGFCEAIAVREGLLWLGSYDSALLKKEVSSIFVYIANY